MTIIAPLIFSAIFMISAMVILFSIKGAMPRISEIVKAAHDGNGKTRHRKITVRIPIYETAQIIPLRPHAKINQDIRDIAA